MADPVKVHKEYDELIDLLLSRGMDVPDRPHAIKNLAGRLLPPLGVLVSMSNTSNNPRKYQNSTGSGSPRDKLPRCIRPVFVR